MMCDCRDQNAVIECFLEMLSKPVEFCFLKATWFSVVQISFREKKY